MKFLFKLLMVFVLFLLLAFFVIGFVVDGIAKTAIEEGAELALGVPTELERASIGIFSQSLTLEGLRVSNPEGYGTGNFLELDRGEVEVALSSLTAELVEIPRVELDGVRISLVQGAERANYDEILGNLERFQGGANSDEASDDDKKFVIRALSIKRVEVKVAPVPGFDLAAVTVPLGDIALTDVGTGGSDEGVDLAELTGIIVEAVLGKASKSGKLPGAVQGPLSGDLRSLSGLGDAGIEALGGALDKSLKKGLEKLGVGR